jgi:hypothetical protein
MDFLKLHLIVDYSQIRDSDRSAFKESLTEFEAALTQQNDCNEDNERPRRELTREKESNERLALDRFEQEQLGIACEKTIAGLMNVRTLLRQQVAD